MKFLKRQNYIGCQGGGWRRWTAKGHEGTFWVMEKFYIMIVVLVTQLYTLAKTHQILHI